jgi:hypothetical protein
MPAGYGAQRQLESTLVTAQEHTLDATREDFACAACGAFKVRLTERESWYVCVNCGYSFGIEPYPKLMRRATDPGSEPTSH